MDKAEVKKLILDKELTVTDVIDAVIEMNGLIGVGIITFSESLNKYCMDKIKTRPGYWED